MADRSAPNVYVFILDTLRFDQLRGIGAPGEPGNFLERTLRSGTLFTRFYPAGGTTRVSVNGMFSGFFGGSTGLNHQHCHTRFGDSSALTLTEVFHHHGYRTMGVTQGDVSLQPVGFDRLLTRQPRFDDEALAARLRPEDGPLFAYLHFYGVHDAAFGEPQRMTADNYRTEMDTMAEEIEAVWHALVRPGDVVVIASDHGCRLRAVYDPQWRFYDEEEPTAGTFLTEDTIRGVCAIVSPSRFPVTTVTALARGIDIYPTLLDGLGLARPAVQGQSLWPALSGAADWPRLHAYVETGGIPLGDGLAPCRCVHDGRRKYIYYATHGEALYDIEADPAEADNLIGQGLPAEAAMRDLMARQLADNDGGVAAYYRASASLCDRLLAERTAAPEVERGARDFSLSGWIDGQVRDHLREQIAAHLDDWHSAGERIALYSASEHAQAFIEAGGERLQALLVAVVDGNPKLVGEYFCGIPVLTPDRFEATVHPTRVLVAHHHYAADIYVNLKNRLDQAVPVQNIYHLDRVIPLWWDHAASSATGPADPQSAAGGRGD